LSTFRFFLIGPEIAKTGRPAMRVNHVCRRLCVDSGTTGPRHLNECMPQ
jgi:hypothetical protein